MKTMSDYTIYCTEEQTIKALELGAQIEDFDPDRNNGFVYKGRAITYPTAEQMRGWLMEQLKATTFANKHYSNGDVEGYGYLIIGAECILECDASDNGKWLLNGDKEATLAAIDAALEYLNLINKKK